MSEYVYAGLTSQTVDIFLQDSSSSTGQGLAGLVFNSAGLVASYRKGATGSRAALSLATQTVGGAWSSGGFVEVDATNMKGVYRLDIPNTVVDTEGFVTLYFYGTTNLLPTALRIDCRPLPVDVKKLLGTSWLTPAVAGTPDVNMKQLGGSTQSATDLKDFADTGYDPATHKVAGVVLVDAVTVVNGLAANVITAASLAADAGAELAALVETYIVNEGDATAVMQAIADKIAADWVAGDASPLAVAAAVWANATRTITGGSLTTSPPTAAAIADAVWDELRSGHTTDGTFGFYIDAAITSRLAPTVSGRTLNVSADGAGDAVLNSEYLFDDGFGRKAVNANVTHYQGTLQGNGDLPAKLDAIKDVTNKIDTGLVLDGVVWQFTVNMLEAAIAEVPKYGDIQRHAQEDYDVTSKTVDVTVTKVT